jgi:hypothetical protein
LRQAVHVDGDLVAFFLVRQGLEEIDRPIEIPGDGGLRRGVVELFDLGDRVHEGNSISGAG